MGRGLMEVDDVHVRGGLMLAERVITASDLTNGVLTLSAADGGTILIVDSGLVIQGIKVLADDGVTDATASSGGTLLALATDDAPPATFTVEHEALGVAASSRFICPRASLNIVPANAVIGQAHVLVRYSSGLQRWVCPAWQL